MKKVASLIPAVISVKHITPKPTYITVRGHRNIIIVMQRTAVNLTITPAGASQILQLELHKAHRCVSNHSLAMRMRKCVPPDCMLPCPHCKLQNLLCVTGLLREMGSSSCQWGGAGTCGDLALASEEVEGSHARQAQLQSRHIAVQRPWRL